MQSRTRHVRRRIRLSLSLTRRTGPATRLSARRIARLAHWSARERDSSSNRSPIGSSAAPLVSRSPICPCLALTAPVSCPMSTLARTLELTAPSYHLGPLSRHSGPLPYWALSTCGPMRSCLEPTVPIPHHPSSHATPCHAHAQPSLLAAPFAPSSSRQRSEAPDTPSTRGDCHEAPSQHALTPSWLPSQLPCTMNPPSPPL